MKKRLCICDTEPGYSYRFMEVVNAKKTCPFLVHAFTSPQTLCTFLKTEKADVLLLAPSYLDESITRISHAEIFLLTDEFQDALPGNIACISKFQKVENILRYVLEKVDIATPSKDSGIPAAKIIGVYSPLHRIGKTSFALALGQEMGKNGRVLYLNLESCSGFSGIFREEYPVDLSDLLYFARQEDGLLLSQLASVTKTVHHLDYIPPAKVPIELADIKSEEWNYLLDQLSACGVYDTILIDFGEGIQGLLTLLSRCHQIYTPIATDFHSRKKLDQYEEMLELLDYTEIIENTRKISLPPSAAVLESSGYEEELLWSPYAGFAKKLLLEKAT